jgi:hypothetical protein
LVVHGYDEQPNYRQALLKQVLDQYKRCLVSTSSNVSSPSLSARLTGSVHPSMTQQEQQQQLMHDIEHVPFDGLTDFFKSAARG